jgi:hypothetical protein
MGSWYRVYIDITNYVGEAHHQLITIEMQHPIRIWVCPRPRQLHRGDRQGKNLGAIQIGTQKTIQDPKFVSLNGIEDTNYPLQPPLNDDPFEHLKNEPFFSFNRFVYNDPWFHEDSHEPYNSQPDRGYYSGQDPLDSRHVYTTPTYVAFTIFMGVLLLYTMADPMLMSSEGFVRRQQVARRYVETYFTKKNEEINALRAQEAELLQATSK